MVLASWISVAGSLGGTLVTFEELEEELREGLGIWVGTELPTSGWDIYKFPKKGISMSMGGNRGIGTEAK